MILISNDDRFTIWQHTLTHKPAGATNACLWIEHDKDADKPFNMEWNVEVKIYFGRDGRFDERLRGWGKTRHDAFAFLRKRLNNLRSVNVRA
jgi:hypothetical protein